MSSIKPQTKSNTETLASYIRRRVRLCGYCDYYPASEGVCCMHCVQQHLESEARWERERPEREAREAAKREAARVLAEREAARVLAARVLAEQEAARVLAEQEAARALVEKRKQELATIRLNSARKPGISFADVLKNKK
jgi:hypothetical protein